MPDKFDDIEIRQESIIKKTYSVLGAGIIEIPKNKVTSVSSRIYFHWCMFIVGFIILALSIFYKMYSHQARDYLFIIGLIIGIILIILFFFIKTEEIVIQSPTETIYGRGEGAKRFYKENKFF